MKNIGIIGLGLIGGSMAKSIRKKTACTIIANDIDKNTLELALKEGVIDRIGECAEDFSGCDLIFICTHVEIIKKWAARLDGIIPNDCVITDVGSTKAGIYEFFSENTALNYIGSHPMAGSEKSGYSNSKDFLFENAYYAYCPTKNVDDRIKKSFVDFIRQIGAIPIEISPYTHDYAVAGISHLPHLVAAALVNTIAALDDEKHYMKTLAAGGFKDITRIASSEPGLWQGICLENKNEIIKVLDAFEKEVSTLKETLNDDNKLFSFFESAKIYRDDMKTAPVNSQDNFCQVIVDVYDSPGAIAQIAVLLSENQINIKNIGILNNRDYTDGVLQIILENESDKAKCITLLNNNGCTVYNKE